MIRIWTTTEDRRIAEMTAVGRTDKEIGRAIGRTPSAVRTRRNNLDIHLTAPRVWTWERDAVLRRLLAERRTSPEIAAVLGVSAPAVDMCKHKLRIRRPRWEDAGMTLADRVHAALADAGGRYVPTADLIDRAYGDRADGGPLTAASIVRTTVTQLRRRRGLVIEGRQCSGYRILKGTAQ